ncbi:MAG: nucleotidyltransferase domain-containing protein [Lachnospiraceae bacterium]|nr:nucleotidyltransferase domain-containing protein [Lachnospiraceae bacterium]
MCKLVALSTNYGEKVKVAEVKKSSIENIIQLAPMCNAITEIILFGSAIEERCQENSDIDIAIISSKSVHALSKMKSFDKFMNGVYTFNIQQEYDRLYFKTIEDVEKKRDTVPICNELITKGKIIYRRM